MSEWSYAGLKVAPGRYSGSTYADNMVVCAHNYAKHFSPIKWLALGSEVYFTDMDGQRWSYEVSNVETIQPTDIDKMITASDEDDWDLTLFTCTTGGRARCAVRCTRTVTRSWRPARQGGSRSKQDDLELPPLCSGNISGKLFLKICNPGKSADFPGIVFSRMGVKESGLFSGRQTI